MPDPCDAITGPANSACRGEEPTNGSGSDAGSPLDDLDPLASLAKSFGKGAKWVAYKTADLLDAPGKVDFTDPGFLQQYAVVFAASTFIVLVVWVAGVAKRAIRGVPLTTAIGEAVSLLWAAVAASAFTPLVLQTLISAVSAVTRVLSRALGDGKSVFRALGDALVQGDVGGGPLILLAVSALTILLCGVLGLLMVVRALGLYVGALLGVVVYAGLVDRDLWGHVRRWSGVMLALIAVEPIVVVIVGLSAALQTPDNVPAGIAMILVAVGVSITMILRTPGVGDGIRAARTTARGVGGAARAAVGAGSATTGVLQGIHAHGGRSGGQNAKGAARGDSPGGSVSGGVAAHSNRAARPQKKSTGDD